MEKSKLPFSTLKSMLAKEAAQYIVKNGNLPPTGHVPAHVRNGLENFIDYTKLIMGTLGYKVFESVGSPQQPPPEDHNEIEVYDLKNQATHMVRKSGEKKHMTRNGDAYGYETEENKFVILAESLIATHPTPSCPQSAIDLRREAASFLEGNRLKQNLLFESSSAAAQFVCYASASGPASWKAERE